MPDLKVQLSPTNAMPQSVAGAEAAADLSSNREDEVSSVSSPPPVIARAPVRVGVVLDSLRVPQWIYTVLRDVRHSTALEVVIVLGTGLGWSPGPSLGDLRTSWSTIPYRLWTILDRRLCNVEADASQMRDIRQEFETVERIELMVEDGKSSKTLANSEIDKLKSAHLDVILCLEGQGLPLQAAECARCGVWSLSFGGNDCLEAELFARMWKKNSFSEVSLVALTSGGNQTVIGQSFSPICRYSLFHNLNAARWKSAKLIVRFLVNLQRLGWNFVRSRNSSTQVGERATRRSSTPANLTTALFLPRWALRTARYRLRKRFVKEQWFIAFRKRPLTEPRWKDMNAFTLLLPPAGRFYADPFLFEKDGKNYIFFEDYRFDSGKGVISCLELRDDCTSTNPQTSLVRNFHLSYPNVFDWKGQTYLLPDTLESGRIELYRATHFPLQWTLESVLIDNLCAVDPTLFEHNGKFWLFLGNARNDELYLFYADSPLGNWIEHPRSPVVTDVRRARPAGRLFLEGDRLIRPAQDCSVRYGQSICFNEIQLLSETEYREAPVGNISPEWIRGNLGSHTFNENESYQVLDGRFSVTKIGPWSWSRSRRTDGAVEGTLPVCAE